MTPRQVRLRYLVLLALRWLPVGLTIPVSVLLMRERGLTLAQIGLVAAVQGFVVLVLELPTGGLADAIGRRPVLIAASALYLTALILLAGAHEMGTFALVYLLQGIFRALDSGPLESWYVDASLHADPDARYEGGLSAGGAVLGVAIAAGALASAGLVALDPLPGVSALTGPVLAAVAVQAVTVVATAVLLREERPAPLEEQPGRGLAALARSARQVPAVIADATRVVRRSRVLVALVSVELLWGFGMITFETLMPPRLAEVVGGPDAAATIMGPAGSAAWLASAAGAALIPLATRFVGAPKTAAALRILQGATVVGLGLLSGPVGVVTAYLACYMIHGAANPVHQSLLHRQIDGGHRTTVLSVNSMVSQPAGATGLIVLTTIADRASLTTAMVVGGIALAAAAPLYLVPSKKESILINID
jgi:MFS family permease